MKIINFSSLKFFPASHENPANPGVFKKVLVKRGDMQEGTLQMVNWALLPAGKSFQPHYHEDLEEIFIIVKGKVRLTISGETAVLEEGNCVIVPAMAVHSMRNLSGKDAEYIAIGCTSDKGGKTVVVEV